MKVFISWSGPLSQKVATSLRDWLPSVLQTIEPYVSSEDIDKGARWSTDISKELEESTFGILCVTRDNLEAPWLNFEAGALSKSFEKGRVSPFLFGLQRADVPPGPLLQFQSTIYERDDVAKLVQSINDAADTDALSLDRLGTALDVWWPRLQQELDPLLVEAKSRPSARAPSTDRNDQDLLAEVLDLVRSQQRLLSTPQELLPPAYLDYILRRTRESPAVPRGAVRDLESAWNRLKDVVANAYPEPADSATLIALIDEVDGPLRFVMRRLGYPSLARGGGFRSVPSLFADDTLLDKPIEELDLTVRSYNVLKREGIGTVREVTEHSEAELASFRNLTSRSVDEIKTRLAELGLQLRDDGR